MKDKIYASEAGYTISANVDDIELTVDNIKAKHEGYLEVLSSGTQDDINAAESEIYTLLSNLKASADAKITRIEPDQASTMVHVEAIGFPANSLATVVVTNPDIGFENVKTNASTETIRFIATVPTDALGKVEVDFDTSRNEIDYTGDYKIRITTDAGVSFEGTYTYGTVELSDVKFKSGANEIADKAALAGFAGQEVTLSMNVNNRLSRDLTPEAYLGIYDGNVLKSAFVQNTTTINANRDGTIEITVELPSTYDADSDLKLFMWDDLELLRPLTKTRFIFEN